MKKIVSIALVLLLIVAMVPMAVFADDATQATDIVDVKGKAEGEKITLGGVEYTLINSADDVKDPTGNYYLMDGLTLTEPLPAMTTGKFNGGGNTITLAGATSVFSGNFGGEGCVISNIEIAGEAISVDFEGAGALVSGYVLGGTFYNITNTVAITGTKNYVGGIADRVGATTAEVSFVNCRNEADITSNESGMGYVGGILGGLPNNAREHAVSFVGCTNNGDITGTVAAGGIVGGEYKGSAVSLSFDNCVNTGKITATGTFGAAGILGYCNAVGATTLAFSNCANFGDVQSEKTFCGGVLGGIHNAARNAIKVSFANCVNMGNVSSVNADNYGVGGIFGGNNKTHNYEASFVSCVNFGNISSAGKYAAGIYGGCTASGQEESIYPVITMSECYNAGAVENATDKLSAFLNISYTVTFPATVNVEKCYTAKEMPFTNIDAGIAPTIAETVGTCELAKVVEAANAATDVFDFYVKNGEVLVCEEHNYADGACKICGAKDPNYVAPNPDPTPDPKPAPTSDITVYAIVIAIISLAGVCVAKKKIRE